MSWFSAGLDALKDVTEKVAQATEKMTDAVPINKEMLAKLTLNTDDMKAQRQEFGDEATKRAHAKDMLAGMFPWETKDAEREILVEECKEAILALSTNEETFFGPYQVPALPVKTEDEKNKRNKDNDADSQDDHEEEEDEDHNEEEQTKPASGKLRLPTEESLEKLSKLEPLPPLLSEFDLDSHVGLIQKLLSADPQLVKMQSTLSGGGAREQVFWRNYFFHCAYTRYEAGLSIDEIWSFNPETSTEDVSSETVSVGKVEEETVDFDGTDTESGSQTAFPDLSINDGDPSDDNEPEEEAPGATSSASSLAISNEFEFVDEEGDADSGVVDPELAALEAEIAKELED